jgi:type IV secretory pathway TraG/TraD family ATPase VirD4
LIRQILQQLEDRGETAIVYDPALEYTPQFYMPERGDVILNPIDARSPYWSPGDELRHEAEALTLATSLFPDRANENPFFTEGPRRIFAHLLTFRPTAEELASWLCHDEELDRGVQATPYASIIDRQAPAQRSGVLAALNMVADTLKLLPRESETTRRWSAESWARSRRGWLFLTSTPETRTRLVPLTSLWLDMLVLRLMNRGQPGHRPVWFVLDELACLQRLPQLHTAVTENRKSNNPVVLGFQAGASSRRGAAMMPKRCCRSRPRRSSSARASPMRRSGSPTRSAKSRSSACARVDQKGSTVNGASAWSGRSSRW